MGVVFRNLFCVWLACASGCGASSLDAPREPSQDGPIASAVEAEVLDDLALRPSDSSGFVLASRLNLRREPGGEVMGRLAVNSPVEVLEQKAEQVRVRVSNGKEGWVPVAFLVRRPVSIAEAVERSRSAADRQEALAWAQRASAMDFRSRDALAVLAAAYGAVGDDETAAMVQRQLEWPDNLLLAGPRSADRGKVTLEWRTLEWEETWDDARGFHAKMGPLSPVELRREGVAVGQPIWLLPSRAPAVEGRVLSMSREVFNECGGTMGMVIVAEADVPDGEAVLGFTLAPPPASWKVRQPSPELAYVRPALASRLAGGIEGWDVHIAASESGSVARAARLPDPDSDPPAWQIRDFEVSPDGTVTPGASVDDFRSFIGYDKPLYTRDFDGDGRLDVFWGDECNMSLRDASGVERARTADLCCGC